MATSTPRGQWIHALSALPRRIVFDSARRLTLDAQVQPQALAQAGLAMLRVREGALGEVFNLGEIPLATAQVEVVDDDGRKSRGAAQVMDASAEYAQALAILDAIMAGNLRGAHEVVELIESGLALRRAEASQREAMLARTRVDFSLLSPATGRADDDE
ncbi:MAG: phosphonate C-P lyase system protein PhnG [Planctomycetes bacterium]|nr:phosphonate C-P lyase system protein PhnG [Planctomycetota bacterium]